MKLSLLIPTIRRDAHLWPKLCAELYRQILPRYCDDVEIIVDDHETDSIGTKRNRLLGKANGEYVAFIDSDDWVSEHYIDRLMMIQGEDCASLMGVITTDGDNPLIFEHSIRYKGWATIRGGTVEYIRTPNHLNAIKSSIAKQFRFPEINHGEDKDWSTQIHESGLLKTEYYIAEVMYHYRYVSNK